MEKSDRGKFLVIFSGLAIEFGGKAQEDNVKLRLKALKEYSINQISQAALWIIKNREEKYPPIPTTREIIKAIDKVSGCLDTKVKAHEQCDIILKYLKHYGRNCDHVFKDEITKYLMTSRWSFFKLDQESVKDPVLKWFRKEFVETYLDYKKEEVELIGFEKKGSIPADNLKQLLPGENHDRK